VRKARCLITSLLKCFGTFAILVLNKQASLAFLDTRLLACLNA